MILNGDSKEKLKELANNSVDAVVTDPPYGLSFMGKKWDYDVPSVDLWREVFRVLKPGGHVLSFGGTRTYHRMVVNIEDAGFEIRDQVMWIYGSGFPKSLDVSKAIDKANGDERPIVGLGNKGPNIRGNNYANVHDKPAEQFVITSAASAASAAWQGWGTALKPANEPIVLARKPLEKGLTVAENVLKYGTGAINVDGCRIGSETRSYSGGNKLMENRPWTEKQANGQREKPQFTVNGRWPANVLFDEAAADGHEWSRFFYVAKASKSERNKGLEGMPTKHAGTYAQDEWSRQNMGNTPDAKRDPVQNFHPTVKPIKLMEYLIKLITPPNGVVLDPFMGSGSTGVAAKNLGFDFIGIELSPEYFEIAKKRIETNKPKQVQLDLQC